MGVVGSREERGGGVRLEFRARQEVLRQHAAVNSGKWLNPGRERECRGEKGGLPRLEKERSNRAGTRQGGGGKDGKETCFKNGEDRNNWSLARAGKKAEKGGKSKKGKRKKLKGRKRKVFLGNGKTRIE